MIKNQKERPAMNQPMQCNRRMKLINRQPLSALITLGAVLTFPLILSSCAQLDQLMGTSAESTEAAQSAPSQEPAPQATVTAPSGGPASAQSTGSGPAAKAGHEQHAPSATAQPAGPDSKQAHDKAVAEKDQAKKDKKSGLASDKKSAKKPSKPEARTQPEDAFLPPVPLPSKPAAIGGSGG